LAYETRAVHPARFHFKRRTNLAFNDCTEAIFVDEFDINYSWWHPRTKNNTRTNSSTACPWLRCRPLSRWSRPCSIPSPAPSPTLPSTMNRRARPSHQAVAASKAWLEKHPGQGVSLEDLSTDLGISNLRGNIGHRLSAPPSRFPGFCQNPVKRFVW